MKVCLARGGGRGGGGLVKKFGVVKSAFIFCLAIHSTPPCGAQVYFWQFVAVKSGAARVCVVVSLFFLKRNERAGYIINRNMCMIASEQYALFPLVHFFLQITASGETFCV